MRGRAGFRCLLTAPGAPLGLVKSSDLVVCDPMSVLPVELRAMPLPAQGAIIGVCSGGMIGAIGGLVVGLLAYPPTAWFAVFELGVPAAIAGGVVGVIAALIVEAARRLKSLIATAIAGRREDTTPLP